MDARQHPVPVLGLEGLLALDESRSTSPLTTGSTSSSGRGLQNKQRRVLFVGFGGAGKTTFITRALGHTSGYFVHDPTRADIYAYQTKIGTREFCYDLQDTTAHSDYDALRSSVMRSVQAMVIVIDIAGTTTMRITIEHFMRETISCLSQDWRGATGIQTVPIPVTIILNKCDIFDESDAECVRIITSNAKSVAGGYHYDIKMANGTVVSRNISVFLCSAKAGTNVDICMQHVTSTLDECFAYNTNDSDQNKSHSGKSMFQKIIGCVGTGSEKQ